jgi:hypothetical protein
MLLVLSMLLFIVKIESSMFFACNKVGAIEFHRVKELCDEHGIVGQIHPWVLPLGTTSMEFNKCIH